MAVAALALMASAAQAQPAADQANGFPTVTTHATARDRLANTVADVQLGVEARGRTLAEVRAMLDAGTTPLKAYLDGAGVEQLRTQAVTIRPELDAPAPGRVSRITGYSGRVSVVFVVEASKLGVVLAESLAKGANTIDNAALHPRQAEVDASRNRLAAEATRLALEQARAVAEAAGRRAGPVRSIEVDAAPGFPRPLMARAAVTAAPAIATEAGDSEVNATVTMTVTLLEP